MLRVGILMSIACATMWAQDAPKPSFDAVSVRPGLMIAVQCPESRMRAIGVACGGPGTSDPERYAGHAVQLKGLIEQAFGVQALQFIGPEWLETARYDITAVVPPGASKEDFRRMLQAMLEDRFHLKVHHETREFPAYSLVLAKGGLKLKEKVSNEACAIGAYLAGKSCPQNAQYLSGITVSTSDRSIITTLPKEGEKIFGGQGVTLEAVAKALQYELRGFVVLDKTGLDGKYDIRFEYAPADVATAGDFSAPSLFTAIEKELGLKLEGTKTRLDCIVVDHIEQPSEN